jgi:hypothetical protein
LVTLRRTAPRYQRCTRAFVSAISSALPMRRDVIYGSARGASRVNSKPKNDSAGKAVAIVSMHIRRFRAQFEINGVALDPAA